MAYCLLFQTQLLTTTLAWLFGRATPRNWPDEGIYEINSLREGHFGPQWMLLGIVGGEWKNVSGCCCKPGLSPMEAEQKEISDLGVWQAVAWH